MQDLSRNANITYQAIQRARPGLWSWIALLLFVGSLLAAVQFRGSFINQLQYSERVVDTASLTAISNVILALSITLAVGAAVAAWRVWWTLSLMGTTALGMPDIAAMAVGRISVEVASLGHGCIAAMRSLFGWASSLRTLALAFMISLGHVLEKLLALLIRRPARTCRSVGAGLGTFMRATLATVASVIRHAGSILAMGTGSVFGALAYVSRSLWLIVSYPLIHLGAGTAWVVGLLFERTSSALRSLGRGSVASVRPIAMSVRALLRQVGKASSQVSTRLWSIASAIAIYLWRKLSTALHKVGAAISTLLRYLWHGTSAAFGYLRLGVSTIARFVWSGVLALRRYLLKGLALVFSLIRLIFEALAYVSRGLWLIVSYPLIRLGAGIAWSIGLLLQLTSSAMRSLGRGSVASVRLIAVSVRALVRHVGKASSQVSTRLWSIASATAIYLWRKLSTAFHQVEAAISTLVSYIWHGVSAVLGYLWLVYPP